MPAPRLLGWRLLLASVLLALPCLAPAQPTRAPLRSLDLVCGVQAAFDSFGNMTLVEIDGGRRILRLGDGIQDPVFAAGTAEGARHGLRGFSRGADDDGDGRVDEDRLDGRDNDGDGLVDEDFAAIGDVMAVWDAPDPDRALHREYYHWSYDALKSALFFSFSAASKSGQTTNLVLQADFPWNNTELEAGHRTSSGGARILHTRAWISAVNANTGEGSDIWLGFKLLGPAASGPDRATLAEQGLGRMVLVPGPQPVAGVVVAARSWRQLSSLLCEAEQVYQGLKDPVTGQQVRWIVPPSCSLPQRATSQPAVWRPDNQGGGTLVIGDEGGLDRIPDPDILMLGEKLLASPDRIQWSSDRQAEPWFRYRFSDFLRKRPAPEPLWKTLDTGEAAGPLVLEYERAPEPLRALSDSEPASPQVLEGTALDGGHWKAVLTVVPAQPEAEELSPKASFGQERDRDNPILSPSLLLGWPNPFRDRVQIRCRVPATAEEAFASASGEAPAGNQDKTRLALPWAGSQPMVSVRIYGLNGQEIKALYAGSQGPGEFVVQWDGTDSFGRPVASGPYLCKLQLDDLSLTRRLVYLR